MNPACFRDTPPGPMHLLNEEMIPPNARAFHIPGNDRTLVLPGELHCFCSRLDFCPEDSDDCCIRPIPECLEGFNSIHAVFTPFPTPKHLKLDVTPFGLLGRLPRPWVTVTILLDRCNTAQRLLQSRVSSAPSTLEETLAESNP